MRGHTRKSGLWGQEEESGAKFTESVHIFSYVCNAHTLFGIYIVALCSCRESTGQ